MSTKKSGLISLSIILALFLLVNPVMAIWTIQSPEYSGTVNFYADGTGTLHLTSPVLWDLNFEYTSTQENQYIASALVLGTRYQIPFRHSNNILTSQAYPDTRIVWVP
jgi:hypothetical protein